ncbi:MAG: carboxymuconolactone decarboxylase family protein [Pseudomonadota bacterium]
MPRLEPLPRPELAKYDGMFSQLEEFFGFLPNDYLTMGRKPKILEALAQLTEACLFEPGKTDMVLRLLVTYIASRAAGCMYCTSHCAILAQKHGLPMEKIEAINDYATHPLFTEAERAALKVADGANKIPNAVSDEDFAGLRKYYDDEAIAEIVGVIAMMSFYNKWNDTLATTAETPPREMAESNLSWWAVGKHG